MTTRVSFTLNGQPAEVSTDPVKRLAHVLRDDLGLTGTKIGCDAGDCGACTVLIDGRQVCACLTPAAQAEGRDVTTVEGLTGLDPRLAGLTDAFHRIGAAQCGICTPGMLLAAYDLLERNPSPSRDEVRVGIAGNLCRCTGYEKIIDSVMEAASRVRGDT